MDFYHQIMKARTVRGTRTQPVATFSIFGWILSGPIPGHKVEQIKSNCAQAISNTELNASLKKFWELESIGIGVNEAKNYTKDEQFAIKHFEETVLFEDGRYIAALPKKEGFQLAKTNYNQCKKRLLQIERRYESKSEEEKQAYQNAISKYVNDGVAEEVKSDDNAGRNVRYLPHHAVIRRDKTSTKTRIVFDASAQDEDGVSLNNCLLIGPALQPDLVSVLLRFRRNRVALMANIEKMFLQVLLAKDDRDLHRYLWSDFDASAEIKIYRMLRVTFGIGPTPFIAISVTRKLANDNEKKYPLASSEIQSNMYVDDYLGGAPDLE